MQEYLTIEIAKELKFGTTLYSTTEYNADETPQRWIINGKVKRWKRDPNRIYIPLKRGLNQFAYLTENDFSNEGICKFFAIDI